MRIIGRIGIVWIIESVALVLLDQVLPGLHLASWSTAIWAVAAFGLLNAIVRPVLLWFTLPFTVMSFGTLSLGLNGLMLLLAELLVPGLDVDSFWMALVAALGLATINTLVTGILSLDDDDSFYRYVIHRIAARSWPSGIEQPQGLIILEIDGLAEPVLRRAVDEGRMPNLARWLEAGSHTMMPWDCGVPSQTASCQAGILYGANDHIPGFRWYEKDRDRLMVANWPGDAAEIDRRSNHGGGLLHPDGSSIANILSGGAGRSVLTMSALSPNPGDVSRRSSDFYLYFVNPYNFSRTFVLMIRELAVESWEQLRQTFRNVRPRVSRRGTFPILRAISSVLVRDISVYLLIEDMFSGVPVVYCSFIGYDVVAHHSGPESPDAMRVLGQIDSRIGGLERATRRAPRNYRFVVLSDHGQSHGATFRQRYGQTLEQYVQSLLTGDQTVHVPTSEGEGWGHLNTLLTEMMQTELPAGRAARRVFQRRTRDGYVDFGHVSERNLPRPANVVVCASGNLGLIYFADVPGRASMETLVRGYPGLVEHLVRHPGISFVLAYSEQHGPLVIGAAGLHYLETGKVEGEDPLAPFGPNAGSQLRQLADCKHTGDLVVNSCVDPETGEVAAFEELVGSHGGLGGPQTRPFLLIPRAWATDVPDLTNSSEMYCALRTWCDRVRGTTAPQAAGVAEFSV